MDLNGPKWTILVYFGLANAKSGARASRKTVFSSFLRLASVLLGESP